MSSCTRSGKYGRLLAICMIALLLAVALSAAAAADGHLPPPAPDSNGEELPPPPPPPIVGHDGTPTPTPTPTRPSTPGGTQPPSPFPEDPTLTKYERFIALAPNRIVLHAATPAQLISVEDGLQYYFIGRDGSTRIGPWIPPFAELKAKYPSGDEVSLYNGRNPLTGKRVKIDYLPAVNRIRVDTFYADRDNDKNKQYIFHFGPEHDITYDVW